MLEPAFVLQLNIRIPSFRLPTPVPKTPFLFDSTNHCTLIHF